MYDTVFVASCEDLGPESVRALAAKTMLERKLAETVICVGGISNTGVNRASRIANLVGENTKYLVSEPSTWGNLKVIKEFISYTSPKRFGILSNFWHLPRICRMMAEMQISLFPIAAEAVIPIIDCFKDWHVYIGKEVVGLNALENNSYKCAGHQ